MDNVAWYLHFYEVAIVRSKQRHMIGVGVLMSVGMMLSVQAAQPDDSSSESLFVVTHIDVMPNFAKPARELLHNYVKDSMAEKGAERLQALVQEGRPNHFTVIEQWRAKSDYDAHVSAQRARDFRTTLQPMLGSPFDERLHSGVQ
jgi:quinol monooxygenase YgiN